MYGFEYTLELLEPVLANGPAGDTNSAQSLRYLAGSLMRGAAMGEYLKGQPALDAGDETSEARRLFFSGATRYLHAYPAASNERTLPAPLAWHQRKTPTADESTDQRDLFDLSINERPNQEQLRGLGDVRFFRLASGEAAAWVEVGEQVNVHTQRDAVAGRAKESKGAVFRYEALPAGLQLKGAILTETTEDAAKLKTLLDGKTLRFGKSRTAGYGALKVTVNEGVEEFWKEISAAVNDSELDSRADEETNDAAPIATADYFLLTMLSDTLVRDDDGQHTLDPLPALTRKLGLPAGRLSLAEKHNSFRKAEIVGGFNRKWGLPLPQVAAIAAGSTFALRANPPHTAEELKAWQEKLHDDGLGERRVEGFGRIAVEWYYDPPKHWRKDKGSPLSAAPIPVTEAERTLTEQMLMRLLRRDLDRLLIEAADGYEIDRPIPNSQLARWRSVIYRAVNERQTTRVLQFLVAEEEKNSRAWEALRRARLTVSHQRLTDWIKTTLTETGFPQAALTKDPRDLIRSVGAKPHNYIAVEPTPEMAIEYRLRLIDGVLALAAKRGGKKHA